MDKTQKRLRRKLVIFNVLFVALSALSICMIVLKPFLSINATYVVTADTLKSVAEGLDEHANIEDIVGDGIKIEIGIDITPTMLLKSITEADSEKYVKEEVVGPVVDKIIADLKPTLNQVINNAVKSVAKTQIREQLDDSIKNKFGQNVNIEEKLEVAGVDIGTSIDNILAKLTDGTNADVLTGQVITEIDDAITKINDEYGANTVPELSQETKDTLESTIKGVLEQVGLVDEDGVITNIDSAISSLMDKFLNNSSDDGNSNDGGADPMSAKVYAEDSNQDELADTIKDFIYGKLPSNINSTIAMVMKIIAGVVGFILFTWAWVALWAMLKTVFAKNPGIFTGIICFLSCLIQIIIGLVLAVGVTTILSGGIQIPMIDQYLNMIPQELTLAIASSLTIPAGCCVAKWILNIPYHFTKKSLKRKLKNNPTQNSSNNAPININVSVNK